MRDYEKQKLGRCGKLWRRKDSRWSLTFFARVGPDPRRGRLNFIRLEGARNPSMTRVRKVLQGSVTDKEVLGRSSHMKSLTPHINSRIRVKLFRCSLRKTQD